MLRILAIVCALFPGLARGQGSCDQSAAEFAALLGAGKDDLFRADLDDTINNPADRWIFVVSTYLGMALQLESATATSELGAILIAADPLLDCWRVPDSAATPDQLAQQSQVDKLLTIERRATLVNLAGDLQ